MPMPVPPVLTNKLKPPPEEELKMAVTNWAADMVTVQEPNPGHPGNPFQPANVAPPLGAAVSVTEVLAGKFELQKVPPFPQLIPAGALVILPTPLPPKPTVKLNPPPDDVKLAFTFSDAAIVTLQTVEVLVQAPVQPVKVDPPLGAAVKVTIVFGAYATAQVVPPLPQLMPAGLLRTFPVPATVTVKRFPAPLGVVVEPSGMNIEKFDGAAGEVETSAK